MGVHTSKQVDCGHKDAQYVFMVFTENRNNLSCLIAWKFKSSHPDHPQFCISIHPYFEINLPSRVGRPGILLFTWAFLMIERIITFERQDYGFIGRRHRKRF